MLNKSTIILLSGFAMGCAVGMLDVFQFRDKGHIPTLKKSPLSPPKAEIIRTISRSKEKATQAPTINNLKNFLQEYKSLSIKEASRVLLKEYADSDSEYNKFHILPCLAYQLGHDSPEEAQSLLNTLTDNEQQNTLAKSLLKGWARTNWDSAVDYLLSHRDKSYAEGAFQILIKERARLNPDEAITWLNAQSETVRSAGVMPLLQGLAENYPERSARFVATTLQPGDLNDVYLLNLVSTTLPKSDWETAFRWINAMDEITRGEYANKGYETLAEVDSARATEEYHKGNEELAYAITSMLTNKSPVQAMKWVEQNIQIEKKNFISRITRDSAAQTPEFTEYVNQMPTGEMKDEALISMIDYRSRIHKNSFFTIEDTLSLASGLSNEIPKNKVIEDSLNLWMKKNPEQVSQWVNKTSDLSNETKDIYIQHCNSLLKKEISR